jgi:hypothetical protein
LSSGTKTGCMWAEGWGRVLKGCRVRQAGRSRGAAGW